MIFPFVKSGTSDFSLVVNSREKECYVAGFVAWKGIYDKLEVEHFLYANRIGTLDCGLIRYLPTGKSSMVNLIDRLFLSQAINAVVHPECVERFHDYTETVSIKNEHFNAVSPFGERLSVNEEVV
ncbi:hypothetical protein A3783_15180 [Exiguobacterium undae]|uniref:Uncharacterized protein n=1 Tax=Exiguobacterium undae TaxID=169177 RepID=A0ABX2V4W5_9BACL|nr:hypothetical protein A3783_15180 [Exiguobacterium undae]